MSQSPYIVNIVELQNVVTNVQGTNTAANIQSLQTAVENLQQMVLFDTKTIAADVLSNFTASNSINVVANLNFSNAGLYSNSNVINFTTRPTIAPNLPIAPQDYSLEYQDKIYNVLNKYY